MTQPEPITPPAEPAAPQVAAPAPPWGTEEQFDPAKAWSLIQNLRGDLAKEKGRVAELTPYEQKIREAEEAQKTEVQRLTEQMTALQQTAKQREAEALRYRIALQHGIPDEDAAIFLTGADEPTLKAQAERLAALRVPQAAPTSRTPVEALRPGALPQAPALSVDERIAELIKDPRKNMRQLMDLQAQKLVEIATQAK